MERKNEERERERNTCREMNGTIFLKKKLDRNTPREITGQK